MVVVLHSLEPGEVVTYGEVAAEAGFPPGVLNVVNGDPEPMGQVMLDDKRLKKIQFTGSTRVGRLLMDGASRTVTRLSARDAWIMDGNYGGTLDLRLSACDTVVFLDLPRRITIPRVIGRWLRHRGVTRPDMAPGCPDRLTLEFLAWIWNYPRRRRPQILRKLRDLGEDGAVYVLRSKGDVRSFLARLQNAR